MKIHPPSTYRVILSLFLLGVFLLTLNSLSDPDTGFHLATGKVVVQEKSVPTYDVLSYTAQGQRWVSHYWLSGVLFYLVFLVGGAWGLIVCVALVAVLTYAILVKIIQLHIGRWALTFVVLVPFVYFTMEQWVVRPQIFTYLFSVFLLYLLELWRKSSYERTTPLFLLLPIMLLWANMHAGVVLGMAIIGAYALGMLVNVGFSNPTRFIASWAIFLASWVMTLLNPNGVSVLLYSKIISEPAQQLQIGEWMSLLKILGDGWRPQTYLFLMVCSLVIVAVWAIREKKTWFREHLTLLFVFSGAFLLPLISVRHTALFPLLAAPIVIAALFHSVGSQRAFFLAQRASVVGLLCALGGVAVLGGVMHVWAMPAWNVHVLPVGAADFIEEHNLQGPMFNTMEAGGYLAWRLWPEQRVFLDGRNEVFIGKPIQDFISMVFLFDGWERVFDSYHFGYAVIRYRDWDSFDIDPVLSRLMKTLMEKEGFRLVYWDDAVALLVAPREENKEIIDTYEYKIVTPLIDPTSIPQEQWPGAEEEFNRALQTSEPSYLLDNYAIRFVHAQRILRGTGKGR